MKTLPITTPEHYLTGTSAMTIPSSGTSFVNWHFVETFLEGKADYRIAGVNFPDTTPLLGQSGVRECGDLMRRLGAPLPADTAFYSADRDRAFLDLLVSQLRHGRLPDHLRVEDCCETEDEATHLIQQAAALKPLLDNESQIKLLDQWLTRQ